MMKKLLDAIWEPFDSDDAWEWTLLVIGGVFLVMFLIEGVRQWITQ